MSLLLATGEQAIVELNSDLFNSTILTTFKTKKKVYLGVGLSYFKIHLSLQQNYTRIQN